MKKGRFALAALALALAAAGAQTAAAAREKVVFDTDIGGDPDDGLALAYLLKEPRCELLGVTTCRCTGHPEIAARVASALCRSLGRDDVPIHAGCSRPIHRGERPAPKDPGVKKRDGWLDALADWPHDEISPDGSAVEFLRRTIRANPGEVTLLATGPLSNVAALFTVDPEIPSLLKRLVVMGGNLDGKSSEWNAKVDVFATAAVLEGGLRPQPAELILVGADVTSPHHLPPDEGRVFLRRSPDLAFVRGYYAEQWFARPIDLYFHDPVAAVAIFHPEILTSSASAIRVDVEDRARTFRTETKDDSTWVWRTATAVDFGTFEAAFLSVMAKEIPGHAPGDGTNRLSGLAECKKAPYMDASLSVDERMEDLISRMTLVEKVAQLSSTKGFDTYEISDGEVRPAKQLERLYAQFPGCGLSSTFRADWYSGRNWKNGLTPDLLIKAHNALQRYAVEHTRLGIPLLLPCGQMLGSTSVPSGLACAGAFDVEAVVAATRMKIRESATVSRSYGIGHPTCDLALDPRWSRVEQTFGEDPFLSAEINYARCRAAKEMGAGAHMAHFIMHGVSEGGRMSLPAHAGDNEIYNLHMRPFEYAVRGGCDNIMTCYNLVDGIPGILRGDLVNGFIRGKLGFRGTFVGDAGAIGGLVWQGFAKDLGEAAALVLRNGNDTCCWEAENYLRGLKLAMERRLITEDELNVSLRRVLRGKFEKGLFEHPYTDEAWTREHGRPEDVIGCRENRDVVLNLARKAMTLLENPKGVLPLDAWKIRRLAVIGPNADKPENQIGDYSAPQRPGQTVTPRMAFEAFGREHGIAVDYALGCKVRSMRKDGFAAALEVARKADAVVLCLGGSSVPDQALTQNEAGTAIAERIQGDTELDKDAGEGFDRATLRLGGVQNELLGEIRKLGKPVVTVLIMGRPLVLDEVIENSDAVLLAWYPGTEGGTAIAETVFGLNNPGGKLPISFPRSEGAIPCYYHALRDRGNYVDVEGSARYPFGYGLSYTTFSISRPVLEGDRVSVTVTNTGKVRGDDVVQMYIRDVLFTVARPRYELKGFKRVALDPGETKTVAFELTAKELGFWNRDRDYVVEPGDFRVWVTDSFREDMEKAVPSVTYVRK